MTRAGLLALALGLVGCKGSMERPSGWTRVEAIGFQQDHDVEIGGSTGPLSTVASHYVGAGQSLVLGVVDGAVVTDPPADGPVVRLEMGEQARCVEGCGPEAVVVTERRSVSLDRFTLGLSPQSGTLRVLVHDPQAPALHEYQGLAWFPVDTAFIVPARFTPDPDPQPVDLSTSRGLTKPFVRAGTLKATVGEETVELVGYQAGPEGALLVPLTDATTGDESYPVGRYLTVDEPRDGVAVLDFNRLTNPWCAYSEHYNCPIPPPDNRLAVAVTAGEKTFAAHP